MFKNIGKTLYLMGSILFWLFIVGGVVCFILVVGDGIDELLIVSISAIISAFLFALPFCGFGKLIQDVTAIKEELIKNK